MADDIDLDRLGTMVLAAARDEILPRFRNLGTAETLNKTSTEDLVTVADRGMEARLAADIAAAWPGAAIVGEEAVFEDARILDRIGDAETCFILDPIDGTWNFAHGLPVFGVIVAVTRNGETVQGLIADPLGGDYVCAEKGGGAWHVGKDRRRSRLSVAGGAPLDGMSGYVGLGLYPRETRSQLVTRFAEFVRVLSLRASAYEYRMLAQGSMHFSLNAELKPWDHAAGVLIHAEAGGHAGLIDGRDYTPTLREGRLMLAPDRDSWQALRAHFGPALAAPGG